MRSTLQSIRARRGQNEKGFTLIELLVVVVIIGVLIAIAIPLYLNYQKSSHDKATASDVRNAAVVMENCFADDGSYPADFGTDGVIEGGTDGKSFTSTTCASGTINISAGSHVKITVDATTPSFTIVGYNTDGHGEAKTYTYDSSKGGVVDGTEAAAPTTTA